MIRRYIENAELSLDKTQKNEGHFRSKHVDNQVSFPYSIVMASGNDFLLYVLDLLREVDGITYRKMMGEYLLYKDGTLFGGVFDNDFLIKKTKSLEKLGLKDQIPYPSAKAMLLIDSEDPDEIKELVYLAIKDLKEGN